MKILNLFLLTLCISCLKTQDPAILGNWESNNKYGIGRYKIFKESGQYYGILLYWKSNDIEFSIENEIARYKKPLSDYKNDERLKYFKELIVFKNFKKKTGNWELEFIFDLKKKIKAHAVLEQLSHDKIKFTYHFSGYTEKSYLKRIPGEKY